MSELTLYASQLSGHCHRVALLLRMLDLPYQVIDAPATLRQTDEYQQLNPFGQVPTLVDGELVLTDSNAILVYLVKRYAPNSHWLPEDPVQAAQVQLWLSKAAGEVRYGPASCRMVAQFGAKEPVEFAQVLTAKLLALVEQHLGDRPYLATDKPTIADLACYSYLAVAPEGGISLQAYPAIQAWIARIQQLPGFFAMPALPLPQ